MFPEYAIQLQGADAIITGDGEDAFLEIIQIRRRKGINGRDRGCLVENSDGEVQRNPERRSSKDLTAYPWPDRRRTQNINPIICQAPSSQWSPQPLPPGCPHSCPFCLTYKKQYQIRDIDNVLDEMEDCVSLGIKVHFIDDLFTKFSVGLEVL